MSDPCSFANIDEFICTKIYWCVDVRFKDHVLHCKVDLDFKVLGGDASKLILDSRDLTIKSVVNRDTQESLDFECKPPGDGVNPTFGRPLVITLKKPPGKENPLRVSITYHTSPDASAAQWLEPEMTSGGKQPYLFTQCQAIHARSLLPCQDTPFVKAPYDAEVSVRKPLVAAMSAKKVQEEVDESNAGHRRVFKFTQPIPIPSYLIVLVCGCLEHGKVGPRSTVWTEKKMLEASVKEFSRVEEQVSTAESLTIPYVWGIYDLLVLPPSFPYGGMENPCLTFVTPTLLAGDQSLINVIAHEIAHSWTGNLVTNKTWEHFWLNEGFTVFFERMIVAKMDGKTPEEQSQIRDFAFIGGWKALKDAVAQFGADHPFTCLVVNLKNIDPDDSFSSVPYEKGSCFLYYLESLVGGPTAFQPFLKDYLKNFEYKSLSTDEWKAYFEGYFHDKADALKAVDWETWLYKPGMPPVNMLEKYDKTLQVPCTELCNRWVKAKEEDLPSFSEKDIADFLPSQVIEFLALTLQENPLPVSHLGRMNEVYKFNDSNNSEYKYRWCLQCCRSEYQQYYPSVTKFITVQGRMKFIRPIYQEMNRHESSKQLAIDTFEAHRSFYHPIAAQQIAKDLGLE